MKEIIIVGGGLAGLTCAIELAQVGLRVLVIEKKYYPFHRVCGEYISNEIRPYLQCLVNLQELGVSRISKFQLTSPSGSSFVTNLQMGGFGISRYTLDFKLFEKAQSIGVEFLLGQSVEVISYKRDAFTINTTKGEQFECKVAIGAFGKRSKLDKILNREFIEKRSPYLGVKYHIRSDFAPDTVALHNFKDGYCGVSKIENDLYNLCYLSHRNNLKNNKTIEEMERSVLHENPYLKNIFHNSEFVFRKPEVINEISFERKRLIENHILMVGDSAGMITPLCGNGMAMAIHGGFILSIYVKQFIQGKISRENMECEYTSSWNEHFKRRLWIGRNIQKLFGKRILSEIAIGAFKSSPRLSTYLIKQTHGKVLVSKEN